MTSFWNSSRFQILSDHWSLAHISYFESQTFTALTCSFLHFNIVFILNLSRVKNIEAKKGKKRYLELAYFCQEPHRNISNNFFDAALCLYIDFPWKYVFLVLLGTRWPRFTERGMNDGGATKIDIVSNDETKKFWEWKISLPWKRNNNTVCRQPHSVCWLKFRSSLSCASICGQNYNETDQTNTSLFGPSSHLSGLYQNQ